MALHGPSPTPATVGCSEGLGRTLWRRPTAQTVWTAPAVTTGAWSADQAVLGLTLVTRSARSAAPRTGQVFPLDGSERRPSSYDHHERRRSALPPQQFMTGCPRPRRALRGLELRHQKHAVATMNNTNLMQRFPPQRALHRLAPVRPNVRVKRATTAGRQARSGDNVPRTGRPGLVACRRRSA